MIHPPAVWAHDVMPCAGCRRMLHLPQMVWLKHGRVGCRPCQEAGR